jgi:hypothetical protein
MGAISLVLLMCFIFLPDPPPPTKEEIAVNEAKYKQSKYDNQFSGGEHTKLVKYITENMNDPDSFKHVDTRRFVDSDDRLVVTMRFRANNAYGALILDQVTAYYTIDGVLLYVEKS